MSAPSLLVTRHTISPSQFQFLFLSHTARFAVLCGKGETFFDFDEGGRHEGKTTFFVWDLLENKKLAIGEIWGKGEPLVCFSLDDRFLALATTSSLVVFDSRQCWQRVAEKQVHFPVDEKKTRLEGLVFDDAGGFVLLLASVYSFLGSEL